jgi:RNA polymerase sigma-70 factor, ECF subfamily
VTNLETLPDNVLAQRAARGETDCFAVLVQRYRARVYGICYRMAGNPEDAEDWAQDCFIRVYEQLGHYNTNLPFAPWLVRVSSNTCLNLVHARTRRRTLAPIGLTEEMAIVGDESPLGKILEDEERCQHWDAIDQLPPLLRQALVLRHQEEMSFREIADVLGIPLQTASTRVRRGLEQVRGYLDKKTSKEERKS